MRKVTRLLIVAIMIAVIPMVGFGGKNNKLTKEHSDSWCTACGGSGKCDCGPGYNPGTTIGKVYCDNCSARGYVGSQKCGTCNGSGLVNCKKCNGTGKCGICKGTGKVNDTPVKSHSAQKAYN